MSSILVIDNYDSFVFTLVDYLRQLGANVVVARNDAVPDLIGFDGVLISPGPGAPDQAGASLAVVSQCAVAARPLLGVCLGHQALGQAFGGKVVHAPQLRHGKTSQISHDDSGVFAGLPNPLTATRYHSLVVDAACLPDCLHITAEADGLVMALSHRDLPLHGVQFHPESILSQAGHQLLANWLALIG